MLHANHVVPNRGSVTIHFNYGLADHEPFYALVMELMETIEREGVGEYDGHGMGEDNSMGDFFMYGPDAAALFKVIEPVLKKRSFMHGAVVTLRSRRSGEGVKETNLLV